MQKQSIIPLYPNYTSIKIVYKEQIKVSLTTNASKSPQNDTEQRVRQDLSFPTLLFKDK